MTKHTGKWLGLTLHHTAGSKSDTVSSIRKSQMQNGYGDIAYNWVLEIKDGNGYLKSGRSPEYNGGHSGNNYYNKNYLAICIVGNYSKYPIDSGVYTDLINGICHIMKKYDLKHLNGHKEIKATQCPGNYVNMNKVRADVSKKLGFSVIK